MALAEALRQRLVAQAEILVVLVSEILTAVTTELTRTGSIGSPLTTALASAVSIHSSFLQADKKQVLKDLPI
jgi:hypothetical protein